MAKRVSVKNHQHGTGNINRFVTAELRQQIVLLKRELDRCEGRLSDHRYVMNEVEEALSIAQECAQCLLTRDPFAAWENLMKRKEEEEDFDDFIELEETDDVIEHEDAPRPWVKEAKRIYEAEGNVTILATSKIRQQIVHLKGQLDEYTACLREVFDNMLQLESLNRAVALADQMRCVDQLESWEVRKRRDQPVEEEEDSLGDL